MVAEKPWYQKALKQLQGHRWVRCTSEWVIRHTNSKTVTAWLLIDLIISLGLGVYYFLFRYVSSLGFVPLPMMNNFKFYILVAGFRAACTSWGIWAVVFRNVRQVKLFYTVFIFNLLVAVWLMIPILSLHCKCDNFYQCEALQSFALDHKSLNRLPQPEHFPDRKVPYENEPSTAIPVMDPPEPPARIDSSQAKASDKDDKAKSAEQKGKGSDEKQAKVAGDEDDKAKTSDTAKEKEAKAAKEAQQNVHDAKDLAEKTQATAQKAAGTHEQAAGTHEQAAGTHEQAAGTHEQAAGTDLMQMPGPYSKAKAEKKALAEADVADVAGADLRDVELLGHHRVVSKKRRVSRPEASLLQMDSASSPEPAAPDKADAEKDEKNTDALEIRSDKEIKVLTYFNAIGNAAKLLSEHQHEGVICESRSKTMESWKLDISRMHDMMKGEEKAEEYDPSFIATIHSCIAEEACAGIYWKIQKDPEDEKNYNSSACTLIGPVSTPNKDQEELNEADLMQSLFFKKNTAAVKELVGEENRKSKLMSKIFNARSTEEMVDYPHRLYMNMCRCDAKSCRSFTQSEGSELGWCYIDEKTRHFCTASEKQVFEDDQKKLWTRGICHQAENYDLSCKCSGIGMIPPKGLFDLDDELLKSEPYNYGSYCQKWNGPNANKFNWCYVGWDSPCVDRRKSPNIQNPAYKDAEKNVPPQFWSEVACDAAEPNERLMGASDCCENLMYVFDGVCMLHLFLSVPMIMVLYNYIANQCGDDIQTIAQFDVMSSSDDEDEGRKSTFSAAEPAAPAATGAADKEGTEAH